MRSRGLLRAAAITAVAAAAGMTSASASAASLSNTVVTSVPEQSIPVSVNFTGASDVPGNDTALDVVARPGGSIPCQPTLQDDTIAAGTQAQVISSSSPNPILVAGEPFALTAAFTPLQTGTYLVCSWLSETDPVSGVVSTFGPTSTAVSVRGPQVTKLTASVPAHAVPGRAFPVRWSTKSDQNLTLYGVIVYGQSCRLNDSVELGHNPQGVNVEPGAVVYGGPVATRTQATVATPGRYVLCSWLEGPLTNEVVAHQATRFTVSAPHPRRQH